MKRFILLLLSIVCILSCSKKADKNTEIKISPNGQLHSIKVDDLTKEEEIPLSSLFKTVKIIPLETNKESLIASLDNMQVHKEIIYILDKKLYKLFLFDKTGKFLRTIGRVGDAPGEYVSLEDYSIDTKNDVIYLLDRQTKKINKHKIPSGEYISSLKIGLKDTRVNSLQYNQGKIYCTTVPYQDFGKNSYMLQIIDANTGQLEGKLLNSSDYNKGWNGPISRSNGFFFSKTSDQPKFVQIFMDTVMQIDKGKVSPILVLNTKKWITQKDMDIFINKMSQKRSSIRLVGVIEKRSYDIFTYIEHQDFIIIRYYYDNLSEQLIHNTKNNKTLLGDFFNDDLTYNTLSISPKLCCSDGTGVYGYISDLQISYFINSVYEGKLSSMIENVEELKKLNDTSNPIIFYYE